jgi:hypothetical protein
MSIPPSRLSFQHYQVTLCRKIMPIHTYKKQYWIFDLLKWPRMRHALSIPTNLTYTRPNTAALEPCRCSLFQVRLLLQRTIALVYVHRPQTPTFQKVRKLLPHTALRPWRPGTSHCTISSLHKCSYFLQGSVTSLRVNNPENKAALSVKVKNLRCKQNSITKIRGKASLHRAT